MDLWKIKAKRRMPRDKDAKLMIIPTEGPVVK